MTAAVERVALGFPGQGGDWTAALDRLDQHPTHPLVRALAARLGTERWADLDPLETSVAQPVTFVAGLVGGPAAAPPDAVVAVVGHSLGEITAATWAGAMDPEAGLDLVVRRGRLGQEAQQQRPGAMAAFLRTDRAELEWRRRTVLAASPGVLEVAVANSPTQFVLSGDVALVVAAIEAANADGGVARRLPIGGAFHSPLVASALGAYRQAVQRAARADPRVPVVSSVLGRALTTRAEVVEALVRGLVLPVDWPAALDAVAAAGAGTLVDAGPGDTLTRLGRSAPGLAVVVR